MQFSSLVLMEVDKETNQFVKELGSYETSEGAEFVTKLNYSGELINLTFDTHDDVEEWQFTAIYDCFNEEIFRSKGYSIEAVDDEYNPTWLVKFKYSDEHMIVREDLIKICELIKQELKEVFIKIKEKEEEYK
ncbi:hypothetical protein K2F40_07560 [Clostridium sp. CM028]|uniref:DUF6762 family protein n=1 Tax=unclassified Clostridium TaxID=2614128 RepID=UPI001C0B3FCC|nr:MULTISPECIES: DUF6762 family protein [unclassified Clostridium]MBU3091844.1 hypothetical protein [Clostridium sp. CF011]MBW9145370.1 hypothetical protein [Clostridium sp. CM027]MBW9148815.1 hypothetical protein [Clostridium sp. CM028]UVE42508.1 hypothetical protein KTC92_08790 [Clostridium sp. CM027]WAG68257.1 hypothetical protein LL036_09030 [Clostridium sp. CF011]